MKEADDNTELTSSSLKRQLLSYFAFSLVFLSLTASLVTAWQASEKIKSSTVARALQLTNNFADQTVLSLLTSSEENAAEAVHQALSFKSVDGVAIFKPEGELLLSSSKVPQIKLSLNLEQTYEQATLIEDEENYWIFSAPVYFVDEEYDESLVEPDEEIGQQLIGYVLLEYNKGELVEVQQSIFMNNIVIALLAAVVINFIMYFMISRLTQPLSELADTMRSAGQTGDYVQAKIVGAKEIQRMAATYNRMMSTLEKQKAEIVKHRDTLESEVEIRTEELKVARDTALTASRHKSEFLANISHELRTPLQAIIGYADIVREELELEGLDDLAEDLGKCMRSSQSLLGLINNILDIAKIEAGKMDLYLQPVRMEGLINDTVETILPMATANNNELVVEKGSLSESIQLDRQKVKQIFLNLLSNASKFTKNGIITFGLSNTQEHLSFFVADTGVGIPTDQLDLIFEQFTQVDGSQTRKFEGTGLGMAITKSFCDMMQAEISVNSELGKGTKFTVCMPIKEAAA